MSKERYDRGKRKYESGEAELRENAAETTVKWRGVPGFEDLFQYSNTGMIRMIDVDEDA